MTSAVFAGSVSTLVSCPRNSMHFAGGQLAVFQDANERPYLTHTGTVSNAENQPTGPGPTGCDENGPAAALLVGHVSIQICSLLPPVRLGPPCRWPILIATIYLLFRGRDTKVTLPARFRTGSLAGSARSPTRACLAVDKARKVKRKVNLRGVRI